MASVLDLVKHYQHAIEKYPNDEQRVLKSIDKLYNLDVTVQHLQDTGVGRTVNALRKEPGNVGQAAKALVYKWKVMVAAEESDQEDHNNDTTSQNGHANGRSYEDSSRQSNNRHNRHENSVKEPEIEEHNKQVNGDYGNKRKYHSNEEGDPHTKKGKYSSSKDNCYKIKTETKMKIEPKNESEDSQDDSSQSDSDSENSQSSEEDRKQEVKVMKIEKPNRHETSKQTSSRDKHRLESDPKNTIERSDKYHRHSSSSNRHSSDKILKEKPNYSDSHKRSKEIERSNEIKEKEHKYLEKEKKYKEESTSKHSERHKSSSSLEKYSSSSKKGSSSKSSSESFDIQKSSSSEKHRSSNSSERHKTTSSSEKHKSSATEKQKINSDKYSSQTDKSSSHIDKHSSSKSGKEKYKHSEKETNEKHKSKDSSSSKEKHSSSSNYKSKDKSSSNEKEYSEKSEKKHSKDKESKYDKQHPDHEKSKKKKHKSSKSKDSEPKKKREDSDDGIDCGSGASFAEALGMISPAKPKKKPTFRDASPNSSNEDMSPATLLAPCAKLAPLPALEISALPEISNNYRPRPPPKFLPHFTDDEALSAGISSKNQRTKVYSGNKVIGKITTLYELCVQVLQEHIDALEYTGGVPYEILKPVVDKATPQQLFMLEHYNAYLMDDTDHLWQKFCEKNFRNKKRAEMETWREMYMRCQEEQEIKLKSLTANIRIAQEAKKAPIKQTKMAYVDSVVKPPRNVLKKQAQHGTAFAATASPAARVASLAAAPNVLKGGRPAPVPISTSSSSSFKPKKAPLMQKALQFMRGRKR